MTTSADQIDEWLSTMAPIGFLASALVTVALVVVAIRFMVHAGRSV